MNIIYVDDEKIQFENIWCAIAGQKIVSQS